MGKTIKVRILVAFDATGRWVASGCSGQDAETTQEWLYIEDLCEPYSYAWVEADVPLPEPVVVKGTVTT